MTRVIVDAANDPSNDAFALPAMQRGIDCRTSSQIGKIRLGEGPPPPIAIDPAKYLLLNGLLHSDAPAPARKNTTFFLQDKGAGGGRQGRSGTIGCTLVYIPTYSRWFLALGQGSELYWYIYLYNSLPVPIEGFPMSERRRIYRKARNAHTPRTIAEFFDGLGKRVFIRSELVRLIDKNREQSGPRPGCFIR